MSRERPTGLADRSVLVTGAGSGIGRASAELFAAASALVTVVDLDRSLGAATVEAIREAGGEAQFVAADVADEASVKKAVGAAVETYGGLYAAHNNAGIGDAGDAVDEYQLANWEQIVGVNLTGVFLCTKHELGPILAGGGGSIVNTSSGLAQRGGPRMAGYCATKAGVLGLTMATAVEYAERGVRVNAILPGGTDTPLTADLAPQEQEFLRSLHPMNRFASPREIAEAAVWLSSDAASFVTGALLPVDGGHLARA